MLATSQARSIMSARIYTFILLGRLRRGSTRHDWKCIFIVAKVEEILNDRFLDLFRRSRRGS
jgi:hypothetical protein